MTMVGVFAFPALLPTFVDAWTLSNTRAGWIAGIYFAAYAGAVPVLVTVTDHIDARRVYLFGALLAAVSAAGFAYAATGFWSALGFRALAGVALAATYMPGLRVLVDRYRGPRQSRAVSFYTSSFSFGTAASFFLAGKLSTGFGWPRVFVVAAGCAIVAAGIVAMLPRVRPVPAQPVRRLLDFRPVLTYRPVMGYVLGYGVHCGELFVLRSWVVAFLAFSLTLTGSGTGLWLNPTNVGMLSGLVAVAGSIAGNELCLRFGRVRTITAVMIASVFVAAGIGFAAPLAYGGVVALALVYSGVVQLDSAALIAGALGAAQPGRQGATMAVLAFTGFGTAAISPIVFGAVLDATGGGGTATSWGVAFAAVAAFGLLGPLVLRLSAGGRA
ncbi:MAG: MFS transporter [Rhodospirillales bacterium]|nr:MFS transporter [Rhodospirillales bacterium]